MKRMLVLMKVAGLFAALATVAAAGPGQGQTRQLTGKVTSVSARSITVKSPTSSLKCATRAGLRLGTIVGKRATMTCRLAAGKLVVSRVKVVSNGKAVRKQSPSSPADPADDDADDPADDDADDPADDDADDPADDDADDDCDDADDPADDDDGDDADDDADDDDCDDSGDDSDDDEGDDDAGDDDEGDDD